MNEKQTPIQVKEEFLANPGLKVMTPTDQKALAEWLAVGKDGYDKPQADTLIHGLNENLIPKWSALIAARLFLQTGNFGDRNLRKELGKRLRDKFGEDAWNSIKKEGTDPTTDLAFEVAEVVDRWYKTESDRVKLEKTQQELEASKKLASGYLKQYDQRVAELEREKEETDRLRKQIAEGENMGWGKKRREKAEELNKDLSKPVQEGLDEYIKQFDGIKEISEDEIRPPQDLAEINKALLERFEDCSELDIQELNKVGLTNIQAVHLSDILRVRLEARRNDQAEQRKKNKEKKEVRDYFDSHELKLEVRSNREGFSEDGELAVQFKKAQRLGVDIFDQNKGFFVETGLDEVTGITLMLDKQGNLIITKVEAKTLGLEVMADSGKFGEEMIYVFGSNRVQEGNNFRFVQENGQFVIKLNQTIIGKVSISQPTGELVITWVGEEGENGDIAGMFVANQLSKKWDEGKMLPGLKLCVASKEEVKKEPKQAKKAPAKEPAEEPVPPVESKEPVKPAEQKKKRTPLDF